MGLPPTVCAFVCGSRLLANIIRAYFNDAAAIFEFVQYHIHVGGCKLQVAGYYFTIAETTQNFTDANIRPKK